MVKQVLQGIIVTVLAASLMQGYAAYTEAVRAITKAEAIDKQLSEIQQDVREIKRYLMETK